MSMITSAVVGTANVNGYGFASTVRVSPEAADEGSMGLSGLAG